MLDFRLLLAAASQDARTMGSFELGHKCAYCGVRDAWYVPDGCVGALCMEPAGSSCFDAMVEQGFNAVSDQRLMKLMRLIPFSTLPPACVLRIAQFTFVRHGFGAEYPDDE